MPGFPSLRPTEAAGELGPGDFIIPLPVAAVKGGLIDDSALPRAAGEGVVDDLAFHGTAFHVLDFIPFRPREANSF